MDKFASTFFGKCIVEPPLSDSSKMERSDQRRVRTFVILSTSSFFALSEGRPPFSGFVSKAGRTTRSENLGPAVPRTRSGRHNPNVWGPLEQIFKVSALPVKIGTNEDS